MTSLILDSGMSRPVRETTPTRTATRRVVTTYCVVTQVRNLRRLKEPSRSRATTPIAMRMAVTAGGPHHDGDEQERQHQDAPVRMEVELDLFTVVEELRRVAHADIFPGVETQRSLSFGSVAESYDRLRPGPQPDAVAWLLPASARDVVDLAAGTGIMTRALLAAGVSVTAVEPDERMRAVLGQRSPDVVALAGTGEAIPLPSASADAVFVSSAWHWMDAALAVPEIARVLRPGGRFAVLGTTRDRRVSWVGDLESDEAARPSRASRKARAHEVVLPAGAPFAEPETAEFSFVRPMSQEDVAALYLTYSDVIVSDAASQAAAAARIRARLRERFGDDGVVDVPMRTRCWRATRT